MQKLNINPLINQVINISILIKCGKLIFCYTDICPYFSKNRLKNRVFGMEFPIFRV